MTPFIHLFKTPQQYYFYDVNTNSNVKISKSAYDYLTKTTISNEEVDYDSCEEEIIALKKSGYLSNQRAKKLINPIMDKAELMIERDVQMCTLQITQLCNLRCLYCPYTSNNGSNRLHSNKIMTYEIAKRSIDFYKNKSFDSDIAILCFYGGEPLINFDLIVKCVQYFESVFNGKEYKFLITTNGTLLKGKIVEFLEEKKFSILLSIDGPKISNDKNRKFLNDETSVFDVVCKNLENLISGNSSLINNITINMVIDPSIPFSSYMDLFLNSEMFNKTRVQLSMIDDSALKNKVSANEKFIVEYQYSKFLSLLNTLGRYDILDKLPIISSMHADNIMLLKGLQKNTTIHDEDAPPGPCLPGHKRLFIDVEGNLYPCERINETEDNIIGNIDNGFIINKIKDIVDYTTSEDCKRCFAFRNCMLCKKAHENCNNIEKRNICNNARNNFHDKLCLLATLEEIRYKKLTE